MCPAVDRSHHGRAGPVPAGCLEFQKISTNFLGHKLLQVACDCKMTCMRWKSGCQVLRQFLMLLEQKAEVGK